MKRKWHVKDIMKTDVNHGGFPGGDPSEAFMDFSTQAGTSVARVVINSLVAAVCSTFVGALSYGVGNALGMRLDQRPMEMLITLIATSQSIGWGLLGAIVGGVAGLIVGAIRRKPAGLVFIGMI